MFAGSEAITLPSAPVTGWIVTVPDVALPSLIEPAVPDTPSVSAPFVRVALAVPVIAEAPENEVK